MASSFSPAHPSSASSPSPAPTSLFSKFEAKVALIRAGAIGFVEALQQVSDQAVSGIDTRNKKDLTLGADFSHVKSHPNRPTKFYAVSYKQKVSSTDEIWSNSLDDKLKLPVFFNAKCTKTVYCFHDQVRKILEDDPDFDKAFWKREYFVDPELVLFDVDAKGNQLEDPLPYFGHDFIVILSKDKQRFVADVTGDQFGYPNWFYSKNDYYGENKHVLQDSAWDFIPAETPKEVEKEDSVNKVLRDAVEQALGEIKSDWLLTRWNDLLLLPEDRQKQMQAAVTHKVRTKVMAAFRSG